MVYWALEGTIYQVTFLNNLACLKVSLLGAQMVVDLTIWEQNVGLLVHPTFMGLNSRKGNVARINAIQDIIGAKIMAKTNIKVHYSNEGENSLIFLQVPLPIHFTRAK